MPQKQVFLLYNNESEKDLNAANQFAAFLDYTGSNLSLSNVLAGEDLHELKQRALDSDVIVPVVSIDFLNLKSAIDLIEEAKESDKNIFPILFRQCPWDQIPALKSLEDSFMPKEKPLNEFAENRTDSVFTNISNKIKTVLFNGPAKEKAPVDRFWVLLFFVVLAFSIGSGIWAFKEFVYPLYPQSGLILFATYVIMNIVFLLYILKRGFPQKFSKLKARS